MPFIETSLTAKVAIRGRMFGNDIVNTLWFEKTNEAEWVPETLTELNEQIGDWLGSEWLVGISDDYAVADITATAQYASTAPSVVSPVSSGFEGQNASSALPSSNCLTVTFLTNVRGRSWRGRNYVSGIPSSSSDDNAVTEAWADALVGAYNALNTYVSEVACQHVIVSHYSGGLPRNSGVTVPVTGYRYHDLNIDSQRRRLNGRGS